MANNSFQQEIENLDEHDRWKLEQIEGYLQLGMDKKCYTLLDQLHPKTQETGLYQMMRAGLASRAEDWSEAAALSKALALGHPEMPEFHIQWAYAVRRTTGIDAAQHILEIANKQFPEVATIPYNLGCYACVQQNLDLAKKYLEQAFEIDPGYIEVGLEDEDLENLKDFIATAQKE